MFTTFENRNPLKNRQIALDWWNSLSNSVKHELFTDYKQFTPAQNHTQLTGREIQNIWAVQTKII